MSLETNGHANEPIPPIEMASPEDFDAPKEERKFTVGEPVEAEGFLWNITGIEGDEATLELSEYRLATAEDDITADEIDGKGPRRTVYRGGGAPLIERGADQPGPEETTKKLSLSELSHLG